MSSVVEDFDLSKVPERHRPYLSDPPKRSELCYLGLLDSEDEYEDIEMVDDDDAFVYDVVATPLLDVLSVDLYNPNPNQLNNTSISSEIFGTISVTNGRRETFIIFHRERDNPEVVDLSDRIALSLSGPNAGIIPFPDVTIEIDLKDRAQNEAQVAKKVHVLDYSMWDHEKVDTVGAGYAILRYMILPYAVIATLKVSFFFKDDDDKVKDAVKVHGTLKACISTKKDVSYATMIFEKLDQQSVLLKSGTFVELSRSVIAVPAYDSLRVEANLIDTFVGIPIVEGHEDFEAKSWESDTKVITGEKCFIQINVEWGSGLTQPPYGRELKRSAEEVFSEKTEESIIEGQGSNMDESIKGRDGHDLEHEKKPRLQSHDLHSSAVRSGKFLDMEQSILSYYNKEYGEVFSVIIGSKEFNSVDVYGTIEVMAGAEVKIFEKDQNHPQRCSLPGRLKSVPSYGLRWIDGACIRLDLKHGDRQVVKGMILRTRLDFQNEFLWCDKKLCSVIRGDAGFAVVHYTFFGNGVHLILSVVIGASDNDVPVHGRIFASYSSYTYSTPYEKEFYRVLLFDEDQPRSCKPESQLLKRRLCMPRHSQLTVDLELVVGGETLRRALEFKIGDTSIHEVKAQKYIIGVQLSW